MTAAPLHRFFAAVGAECRFGEWVAPCPLYADRHRDGADPRKVVISPGRRRRCLVYCRSCGRDALGDILTAWGVSSDELEKWAAATPGWESSDGGEAAAEYDFALLHRAYTDLLRLCPLTAEHRKWLNRRGVSDALADFCGYGSLGSGAEWQQRTLDAIHMRWDGGRDRLATLVPGLHRSDDLRGPGVAIPCRSADGRIRAVKVRLTDGGRSRMRLLTSRFSGGLAAVNDLHFARPVCGDDGEAVCVTEGERKADVVASRWRWQVVAVPGVGCVGKAVDHVLAAGRGEVMLAFDLDAAGAAATKTAAVELRRRGYSGGLWRVLWGGGPTASAGGGCKGVDDAIAAGLPLRFEEVAVAASAAIGPPPHSPPSLADVRRVLGTQPQPLTTLYRQHPRLQRLVQAAIRGGELAFAKVSGVGGCVAVPEVTAEEWQQWTAASSSAASATAGAGGPASG